MKKPQKLETYESITRLNSLYITSLTRLCDEVGSSYEVNNKKIKREDIEGLVCLSSYYGSLMKTNNTVICKLPDTYRNIFTGLVSKKDILAFSKTNWEPIVRLINSDVEPIIRKVGETIYILLENGLYDLIGVIAQSVILTTCKIK